MQWLELTIRTSSAGIETVAERLTVLGYDSFIMDDQEEFYEFLKNNRKYWDYVDETLEQQMQGISQIRLYLEDNASALEVISALRDQMRILKYQHSEQDLGSLDISISNLKDEDWENNWKQYYQPLEIGNKLLVVPKWLNPGNEEGRIPVLLDPGMIFGTGAHASTQMCMTALEKTVSGGETVIDLGSGSGILSITALLLGAKSAVGVDIDPKAEDIARENAAINDLHEDRFTAITGDVITDHALMEKITENSYDIVLANIVADVIIPLAQIVPHFLHPNGVFICSGILENRLSEVLDAICAAGLITRSVNQMDDWCQITAVSNQKE